jgi:hypothetical protein
MGSSNQFIYPEIAITNSFYVAELKIKQWLKKICFEYWAATPGMRQ